MTGRGTYCNHQPGRQRPTPNMKNIIDYAHISLLLALPLTVAVRSGIKPNILMMVIDDLGSNGSLFA